MAEMLLSDVTKLDGALPKCHLRTACTFSIKNKEIGLWCLGRAKTQGNGQICPTFVLQGTKFDNKQLMAGPKETSDVFLTQEPQCFARRMRSVKVERVQNSQFSVGKSLNCNTPQLKLRISFNIIPVEATHRKICRGLKMHDLITCLMFKLLLP